MTLAKGEIRQSEKRIHSYATNTSRSQRYHKMPAKDIRKLFIAVGWVGRRRERSALARAIPFFDRGPGSQR